MYCGKRTVFYIIACLSLLLIHSHAKYSGGTGEPNDPFLISTPNNLNAIGLDPSDWNKQFLMTADINMIDIRGSQFNIIGTSYSNRFTGVFDGNGHAIYNFTYESASTGNKGIFGTASGLIKNLGLVSPDINTPNGVVGSLVGELYDSGQVVSCWVEGGTIICLDGGGLIGTSSGEISQCYSRTDINGRDVGGLTGKVNNGIINQCFSESVVNGTGYVGGLVSHGAGATISDCYAIGQVSGGTYAGGLIGGLLYYGSGTNEAFIVRSYAAAEIVSGTTKGGLIAAIEEDAWLSVLWSYWDIEASGEPNSAVGIGKNTSEMMSESIFIDWYCSLCWTIDDGNDYPRLSWENKPGILISKADYGGGVGTEEDPYLIYNTQQFLHITLNPCDWGKHFKLMADVDLSGLPEGTFNPIGFSDNFYFSGVFDGNNHSIYNLSYSQNENYSATFGCVKGTNAEIQNLILIEPNILTTNQNYYVAPLVGYLNQGKISNCHVIGGNVLGQSCVGGLVGFIQEGTVENSSSSADVTGFNRVGGLVGKGGTIYNSFASGNVHGQNYVGGISGSSSIIMNCYSKGDVSGQEKIGGLIGYLDYYLVVFSSYSVGHVTGITDVGGLIGCNYNNSNEVRSSYWDVDTSGHSQSAGGTPKATAQMKLADTYKGWGCEGIWIIDEPNDYPHLWWENTPGEPIEKYYYSGGTGEPNDPYIINNFDDFNMIALNYCDWDSHFRLNTDLNLSGTQIFKIGNFINPFSGIFDGNGFSIFNFNYTIRTYENDVGLFGIVDGINACITNLTLVNPYIYGTNSSSDNIATIVGNLKSGTISNCQIINGLIDCDERVFRYTGGLAGRTGIDSFITNCVIDCDVKGYMDSGGITSYNYGDIYDSHWSGSVYPYHGGFVVTNKGNIARCTATGGRFVYSNEGNITYCSATGQFYGDAGFVGQNYGIIDRCYANVTLTNGDYGVGGFVGYNNGSGKVSNCYAVGSIQGNKRVGGFAGYVYQGNIENCYCLVSVSGSQYVGSAVGDKGSGGTVTSCYWDSSIDNHDNGIGTGLPTSQLKIKSTFTNNGWEFVEQDINSITNPWRMCQNGTDYPRLSWQFPPEDFLCPDIVDFADYSALSNQWLQDTDGIVNFFDWARFANSWSGDYLALNLFIESWLSLSAKYGDIAPPGGDGFVDWRDLALLCENWLNE